MYMLQRDELRETVEDEIEDLEASYRADGIDALIAEINERSTARGHEDAKKAVFYHLGTEETGLLAGNLPLVWAEDGWFEVIPPGFDDDEPFMVKARLLPDDLLLAVALSMETLLDTVEIMVTGAAWTLAVALPVALFCGWVMAAMVLRRIDAITQSTIRIRESGLSARVPVGSSGDEFDRLAAGINAMIDSIETLTRNIQEVSIGIAHDLRTPLTHIRNKLVALKNSDLAETNSPGQIDSTVDEVDSVLETFNALLRIGQIEARTRRTGFESVDLSRLAGDLAETFEAVAETSGKILTHDIAPGITVMGDQALLVQMVVNAVENAIEHTPEAAAISVDLFRRDGRPVLVVADNGPGIPADQ